MFLSWCDRWQYRSAMPHRLLRAEMCVRQLQSNHFGGKRISVQHGVSGTREDGAEFCLISGG
ncbi:unnamed protein product [Ectocarpus sp. CCAP 1310/34]|nr:unnamed protein product [Ectocarpus sp. CCAP 1310/34]